MEHAESNPIQAEDKLQYSQQLIHSTKPFLKLTGNDLNPYLTWGIGLKCDWPTELELQLDADTLTSTIITTRVFTT